ncbi:aldo/keto reductase, diketogulonate reductase [Sanguibacter keddieii DSM 10542]|uniref:Aldo/keto reductase, diketogulonate reductase n=1 Tax=Sanguibacter keddieii (strain ATCC 51767 / DSM 10542 / NCFB 3025 / ST-74) TaxID=446469 RepID=D1BFA1_SANKS|nr:aldo/keto reductase [Sanguibacter keddieii]ACZ21397.1 aldo/keto reductase, diketogulonate reductase [Sanguibacter keddieii DSM 10542]
MADQQLHVTLNNGVTMPALGLGVYQSSPEETTAAVVSALQTGYRHIDTAAAYFNEREVGEGIKRSGVERSEIFVETKIWMSDYGYEETLRGFEKSRRKLDVDQIDLLVLHQPLADEFDKTIAAYRALETLLADGRVRAIGVSNFMPSQLQAIVDASSVVPAVNQIEVHPYFSQPQWRVANDQYGVLTQSWSPIGGSYTYGDSTKNPFTEPVLTDLAGRYGKTPAQVMLRWHIDHGFSAIPKSVKAHRIAENFDVFDFSLAPAEIAAIDALDTGVRGGPDSNTLNLDNYGFAIPE